MLIKDRLRTIRKDQQLTLKDVAERTGLSISYLSDIETGRTNPSLKTVEALASALQVTPQFLLTDIQISRSVSCEDLPHGLRALIDDDSFADEIDNDWIELLGNIHIRGKRLQSKRDWMELYLHLRRLLE